MKKRESPDTELLKSLSKVSPTNIVRVNLGAYFQWPELREIESNKGTDDTTFEEREWQ